MKTWSLKLESRTQTIYTHDIHAETPRGAFQRYLSMYPGERERGLVLVDWVEVKKP
jgi:hypothetical protein